jgi:hypothetical protein
LKASLVKHQKSPIMKTFIPALTMAALAATSAVAQAPKVERIRADAANICQSIGPGNQTFPEPPWPAGASAF